MKKTVLSTVLVSTIILGSSVAMAATEGATPGNPAKRITDGLVSFIENDEPTNPVDPTDPGTPVDPIDPIDPENPIEPGTKGPLSLDYASSFNFGEHKITSQDETYFAAHQVVKIGEVLKDVPLYAQVTDGRGEYTGWSLGVKQNGQFKTEKGDILEGAQIKFLNAEAVNEEGGNAVAPSKVSGTVDIVADGTTTHDVMEAKVDEGQGTWVYRMGDLTTMDESVALEVPGATTKKKAEYKTTLTWILNATPTIEEGE